MRITHLGKVLIVLALFALMAIPAMAHTTSYSGGNRVYCGADGCYRVDSVHSTYHTYRSSNMRYDYHRGHRGDVDIDIDIDIDIDCDNNDCNWRYDRRNNRYDRYRPYYYNDNVRIIRGVEYTYPYNHRVVRTGYPYYTTQRYSYW